MAAQGCMKDGKSCFFIRIESGFDFQECFRGCIGSLYLTVAMLEKEKENGKKSTVIWRGN